MSAAPTCRSRPAPRPAARARLGAAAAPCSLLSCSAPCWSGRPPRRATTSPAAIHGVPAQAARQRRDRAGAAGRRDRHRPPVGADPRARWSTSPRCVGLVLVLVMGSTINGSRSWLMLGGLSVQPSEFAKLAVVIGMALVVAERAEGAGAPGSAWSTWSLMLLVAGGARASLILLQPDLGTMLVLTATVFGVLAVVGRAAPLAGAAGRRRRRRAAVARGGRRRPQATTRSTGSWPSPTPTSTRAAPATTSSRRGSPSATAACSARASSTARRPAPASCPSSTPTSSSPSPARSSAWSAPGCPDRAARRGAVAALVIAVAHRRRLRPGRRRRHRLLVRLPGLPEHRDVPGHHAGHRRPAAVRVVRRQLDVRRACWRSACCRTSTCARRGAAGPPRPPAQVLTRGAPGRRASAPAQGLIDEEHERREEHQVHAALERLGAARDDGEHRDHARSSPAARSASASGPARAGPSSQIEATAIAGMVRPIEAIAEPKARLSAGLDLVGGRPRGRPRSSPGRAPAAR